MATGASPPTCLFEQAAAVLHDRVLAPSGLLTSHGGPLAGEWTGAEVWCQVYDGGRGLDPHFDKDEAAWAAGGAAWGEGSGGEGAGGAHAERQAAASQPGPHRTMRCPAVACVVYLLGGASDCPRLGPTYVLAQTYDPRTCAAAPPDPDASCIAYPVAGAALAFDGRLAHGVLPSGGGDGVGGEGGGGAASPPVPRTRAALLVNWWRGPPPKGVGRAGPDALAGLARPLEGGGGDDDPPPVEVAPTVAALPPATSHGAPSAVLLSDLLDGGGEAGGGREGGGDGGGGAVLPRPPAPQPPSQAPLLACVSHPGYDLVAGDAGAGLVPVLAARDDDDGHGGGSGGRGEG